MSLESWGYKLAITPVTAADLIEANFWSEEASQGNDALNQNFNKRILLEGDKTIYEMSVLELQNILV